VERGASARAGRRASHPWVARACLLAAAALIAASPSRAEEPAPPLPSNYVAEFLGTMLAYRPEGGPWGGWQHDATPLLGYGRQLTPTLALELDAGPTFLRGDYSSFSLTPGLVWSFSPHAYAAARFIVPVDPETNFVLFPGIGLCHAFGHVMPILELNVSSAVGRGHPDLGVSLTAGLLVFF
jgi:hypothetical protein